LDETGDTDCEVGGTGVEKSGSEEVDAVDTAGLFDWGAGSVE
jgi:hypothetical protein